jgi:hypothetical protein
MCEQQQPHRISGRSGSSDASTRTWSASVSSATTAASGYGNVSSVAASTIPAPQSSVWPHARGTRTRPAANDRPQAWHSYSGPIATAVFVLQSGHLARSRDTFQGYMRFSYTSACQTTRMPMLS